MSSLVSIRNVTKTYQRGPEKVQVLHGIDLDIPHGDFVALMGPSGSGKTTLLNLIGGLDTPTGGEIEIEGQRIDRMKAVEDRLALDLLRACEDKIAAARRELDAYQALSAGTTRHADALSFFHHAGAADNAPPSTASGFAASAQGYGLQLERSILELVQEQSRRLQTMGEELDTVRASLNERKVIERAKGLLMAHRHLSEEEAHKTLRQMAMNQNRRLIEVAEAVLAMADVLPGRLR